MKKASALITQAEKLYSAACAERREVINKAFLHKEDRELAALANYHIGVVSGMKHLLDILQIKVKERPLEIEYVKWDENYSNGIELFDSQHKELFNIIRQLHRGICEGKDGEALETAVAGPMGYIDTHFTSEENAMLAANYPGYYHHRNLHVDFTVQVCEINNRRQKGDLAITVELVNFLMQWLKNHVQTVDRAYGSHLKAHGIS